MISSLDRVDVFPSKDFYKMIKAKVMSKFLSEVGKELPNYLEYMDMFQFDERFGLFSKSELTVQENNISINELNEKKIKFIVDTILDVKVRKIVDSIKGMKKNQKIKKMYYFVIEELKKQFSGEKVDEWETEENSGSQYLKYLPMYEWEKLAATNTKHFDKKSFLLNKNEESVKISKKKKGRPIIMKMNNEDRGTISLAKQMNEFFLNNKKRKNQKKNDELNLSYLRYYLERNNKITKLKEVINPTIFFSTILGYCLLDFKVESKDGKITENLEYLKDKMVFKRIASNILWGNNKVGSTIHQIYPNKDFVCTILNSLDEKIKRLYGNNNSVDDLLENTSNENDENNNITDLKVDIQKFENGKIIFCVKCNKVKINGKFIEDNFCLTFCFSYWIHARELKSELEQDEYFNNLTDFDNCSPVIEIDFLGKGVNESIMVSDVDNKYKMELLKKAYKESCSDWFPFFRAVDYCILTFGGDDDYPINSRAIPCNMSENDEKNGLRCVGISGSISEFVFLEFVLIHPTLLFNWIKYICINDQLDEEEVFCFFEIMDFKGLSAKKLSCYAKFLGYLFEKYQKLCGFIGKEKKKKEKKQENTEETLNNYDMVFNFMYERFKNMFIDKAEIKFGFKEDDYISKILKNENEKSGFYFLRSKKEENNLTEKKIKKKIEEDIVIPDDLDSQTKKFLNTFITPHPKKVSKNTFLDQGECLSLKKELENTMKKALEISKSITKKGVVTRIFSITINDLIKRIFLGENKKSKLYPHQCPCFPGDSGGGVYKESANLKKCVGMITMDWYQFRVNFENFMVPMQNDLVKYLNFLVLKKDINSTKMKEKDREEIEKYFEGVENISISNFKLVKLK